MHLQEVTRVMLLVERCFTRFVIDRDSAPQPVTRFEFSFSARRSYRTPPVRERSINVGVFSIATSC